MKVLSFTATIEGLLSDKLPAFAVLNDRDSVRAVAKMMFLFCFIVMYIILFLILIDRFLSPLKPRKNV